MAGHSACTAGVAEQAGKLKAEFYRERGMGQTVGMGMKVKASVTAGGPRGTQLAPDPLWVNSQHGQLLF